MLNEGRYTARAIEGGLGNANNGNPQIAVRFQILDEGHDGQEITWFGSFSKNKGQGSKTPLERTIESLRVCGWEGDDLSDLTGIDANEVSLVIEHEEYEGKTQAKVKWVNRPGGLALKAPMSVDSAKAFAAKMKGEVIAASKGAAPAAKTSPKNGGKKEKVKGYGFPDDERGPPDDDEPNF